MLLGIFFSACLTPKSPRTSSAPPRIASNLYLREREGQEKVERGTKDSRNLRSVKHFYRSSHSSLCQSSPTKDLHCFIRTLMSGTRREHFQEPNRSGKMCRLLLVRHQCHLICDILKPCLVGLTVRNHFGKPGEVSGRLSRPEAWASLLLTNDWLLNELLSKHYSLIAPFQTFLCHKSHHAGNAT